jgi:hypothetical protein
MEESHVDFLWGFCLTMASVVNVPGICGLGYRDGGVPDCVKFRLLAKAKASARNAAGSCDLVGLQCCTVSPRGSWGMPTRARLAVLDSTPHIACPGRYLSTVEYWRIRRTEYVTPPIACARSEHLPAASSLANSSSSSFFLLHNLPPNPTQSPSTHCSTHIRRSIVAQPYPEPPRPPDKIGPGHRHPKAGRKCFGTSRSQPCCLPVAARARQRRTRRESQKKKARRSRDGRVATPAHHAEWKRRGDGLQGSRGLGREERDDRPSDYGR